MFTVWCMLFIVLDVELQDLISYLIHNRKTIKWWVVECVIPVMLCGVTLTNKCLIKNKKKKTEKQ